MILLVFAFFVLFLMTVGFIFLISLIFYNHFILATFINSAFLLAETLTSAVKAIYLSLH